MIKQALKEIMNHMDVGDKISLILLSLAVMFNLAATNYNLAFVWSMVVFFFLLLQSYDYMLDEMRESLERARNVMAKQSHAMEVQDRTLKAFQSVIRSQRMDPNYDDAFDRRN